MKQSNIYGALTRHLFETRGLSSEEGEQLVQEIVNFFRESPEAFVRRRHHELRDSGLPNQEIFEQIATELPAMRFPAGPVSMRKIRRMIYG